MDADTQGRQFAAKLINLTHDFNNLPKQSLNVIGQMIFVSKWREIKKMIKMIEKGN